jgi:hypothetical protein
VTTIRLTCDDTDALQHTRLNPTAHPEEPEVSRCFLELFGVLGSVEVAEARP